MDRVQFLHLLRVEGDTLLAVAAKGVDEQVPTCPGWTVRLVLEHTAEVYEHKIEAIRLGGPAPSPWPPAWPSDRDPLAWFAEAHERILSVLTDGADEAPSWTWWPADQTAGFWIRRMAQETVIHRADVQSAFGPPAPIDPDLAVDGIDEVLQLMLSGDWGEDAQPDSRGVIVVDVGIQSWTIHIEPERIDVVPGTHSAAARISGTPSQVLLWLWGRLPDTAITMSGSEQAVRNLRNRLALATQ